MKRARRRPQRALVTCKLPHERDQSIEAPGDPRRSIAQAARDLEEGQVDTDNYTRVAAVVATAAPRTRRR